MDLDFDALRAEAGLTDHKLKVGGRTFALPPIMPIGVQAATDQEDAIRRLFGVVEPISDEDVAFLCANLSMFRSDQPTSEFDPENPETDFDVIAERVYGIVPNREARRERAKKAKKDK